MGLQNPRIWDHGCSKYVQCESTIWGGFSVLACKGHNSWLSFRCQSSHRASTLHCKLWLSFGWYQDVLNVVKNSFPEFHGNHNMIHKHQTLIDDGQRITAPLKLLKVKIGEKRFSIFSVWSVMALWVEDLDTALQIKLSGMSRRPSDSIKSSPKRLYLKSATYTFPDAVLSSILIIASNSPVIWTQSPEALHTTCLVDVSGGWSMVFHSLCEMRVVSEVVFICKWTGWLFSLFPVWLWVREKSCYQTVYMCFSLQPAFVMWSLVCSFMHWWGAESFFVSLLIVFMAAVCFKWIFLCKMPASTIPASGWRFLLCWSRWCWVRLSLNGVNCECCSGCWLLYHTSDSPVANIPLQLAIESCPDFVFLTESLCGHPYTLQTSTH